MKNLRMENNAEHLLTAFVIEPNVELYEQLFKEGRNVN